jgi:hypothetical protein
MVTIPRTILGVNLAKVPKTCVVVFLCGPEATHRGDTSLGPPALFLFCQSLAAPSLFFSFIPPPPPQSVIFTHNSKQWPLAFPLVTPPPPSRRTSKAHTPRTHTPHSART